MVITRGEGKEKLLKGTKFNYTRRIRSETQVQRAMFIVSNIVSYTGNLPKAIDLRCPYYTHTLFKQFTEHVLYTKIISEFQKNFGTN